MKVDEQSNDLKPYMTSYTSACRTVCIMLFMSDYLDEISLFIISCIFAVTIIGDPFSVAGFLSAIAVVCGGVFKQAYVRVIIQMAYLVASCFSIAFVGFLPIVAYTMMHERSWIVRFAWIAPICAELMMGISGLSAETQADTLLWVTALCAVASMMAIKDTRSLSEHASLQRAYDTLKERSFMLKENAEANANRKRASHDASDAKTTRDETEQEGLFFEGLTQRELAVVYLVAEGMDNREISQKLFLSEGTVRNHISSVLSKKGLQNRTQIAVMYYKN